MFSTKYHIIVSKPGVCIIRTLRYARLRRHVHALSLMQMKDLVCRHDNSIPARQVVGSARANNSFSINTSKENGPCVCRRFTTQSTNGDDRNLSLVSDVPALKTMHKTLEDHHLRLLKDPDQPEDARCLKVAVIGAPNAGKSTLTNALLGWRVSSTSSKVHTTRSRINAVLTEGNTQLVFLDTPGMIHPSKRKKHNLEHSLVRDPYSSLYQADIIAVTVDVSVPWVSAGLDKQVLKALTLHQDKHAILILNKVDLLKSKQKLFHLTRLLTEGIIDGKRDSFISVATTKKRIHHLLEEKKTVQLLQKHVNAKEDYMQMSYSEHAPSLQTGSGIESELHGTMQLRTDIAESILKHNETADAALVTDSVAKVSKPSASESKVDLWNAGGIFCGQKVISKIQKQPRKNMASALDIKDWEEYVQSLERLKESVRNRMGWDQFKQVFMVSSTEDDGVDDLKDYLMDSAASGDWLYHSSVMTDQAPMDIIKHCIWEKLLDRLPNDIPYNVDLEVEMVVDDGSIFRVVVNVVCPTDRHMRFVMGKGGRNISQVAADAKQALMNTFRCDMSLMLIAKIRR